MSMNEFPACLVKLLSREGCSHERMWRVNKLY
jgi:hypothetical protein